MESAAGSKPKACHKRRHHDGPEAHERRFVSRVKDAAAFEPELVDVRSVDDGGFHRDTHEHEQSQDRRDAKGRMGEFQGYKGSHGLGHHNA